ncbi:MAG: T9SS type A sorting domain-containing protein [Bacteroidales bacterium]|nr:T9SS type A sorting domain-containing protein [Bacteroidales bacterium]
MNLTKKLFLLFFSIIYLSATSQENWLKIGNEPVLPRDTIFFPPSNDIYANSDPFVIKDNAIYKMWYTCAGGNYPPDTLLRSRLCYCTSMDGIQWTKWGGNPVIDVSYNGGWDSLGVETICVIIDSSAIPSERYKAWYAGQYYNELRYDIGYAWSSDGIHWTKYNSPVLSTGNFNEWDNAFLEGPCVIKDGNLFKMWYAGYDLNPANQQTFGRVNIGLATSTDGINWQKFTGNPVLTTSISGWDMLYVQDPHVIKIDGMYHMWFGGADTADYGGYGQQTGYAYSFDGISWTKSVNNPILKRGNITQWDYNLASFPSVIFDADGTLKMWYTGRDKAELPGNLDYFWEIGMAIDSSNYQHINSAYTSYEFSIYPNPVVNKINICLNQFSFEKAPIEILDIMGRILSVNSAFNSESCYEIDISFLDKGIYFIRLETEKGYFIKKMIVK